MKKPSNISNKTRMLVYEKTGGKCWYCGTELFIGTYKNIKGQNIFCVEHLNNYGGDHIDNLLPSCRRCNTLKRDKTLEEFRVWLSAPSFSEAQIWYLKSHGIELPKVELFVFWGENQNG